jgi:hypothetical protein
MSLFDFVSFGPADVKAVANGVATRSQLYAMVTSQTCGEACWHAREEICRCSCGGRNHGCLSHGGTRPERTAKIDGHRYKLAGVGLYKDLVSDACEINRQAGYSYIEKPIITIDGYGASYTEADAQKARAEGKPVAYVQYKGTWRTTDSGAPARLKTASASQRKWTELSGWKDTAGVYLLWERLDRPAKPVTPIVDENGNVMPDALPKHCYA